MSIGDENVIGAIMLAAWVALTGDYFKV